MNRRCSSPYTYLSAYPVGMMADTGRLGDGDLSRATRISGRPLACLSMIHHHACHGLLDDLAMW